MARFSFRTLTLVALTVAAFTANLAAQSDDGQSQAAGPAGAPGWTVTPSLLFSTIWDDNVLVHGQGDTTASSWLNVVNPRGTLDYNGRRGQLSLDYDGAFLLYRDLDSLNSYDQHGSFSSRRRLSPRLALFTRNSLAITPTTDLVELVGVPFVRTGSTFGDVQGGVDAQLTKTTSIVAAYRFQVVRFDETPSTVGLLNGGHSHGATLSLRHTLSARAVLTADYDLQHATVGEPPSLFDVQNANAGIDYRITAKAHVTGAFGISRLGVSGIGPARTGPSWRAGFTQDFRGGSAGVVYARSFVPSYGFGGTFQNEELVGHMQWRLTREIYTQSSASWRRNESLVVGEPSLQSLWITGSLGYALAPWLHVEGFYDGTHQTIDRPGGVINRSRLGIQIITAKPTRIR